MPQVFAREVILPLDEANQVQIMIDYSSRRVRRWEVRSDHSAKALIEKLNRSIVVSHSNRMIAIKIGDESLYNFDIRTGVRIDSPQSRLLTEIELRLLANGSAPAFHLLPSQIDALKHSDYRLFVDLHTHYVGELSSIEMLRIAEKGRSPYPVVLMQELGIETSNFEHIDAKNIILGSHRMSIGEHRNFVRAMSMNAGQIGNFLDLERAYRFRDPIAKNRKLAPALLGGIAKSYSQIGVNYAELSISARLISELGFLESLGPALRRIEKDAGVRLRFLASLQRSNSLSQLNDLADKVMTIADNYDLAGVDFVGEETNSVADFASIIQRFRKFKDEKRPHFQIRVHAGESPAFPDNVRLAVLAGATRIGHGVFGVDAPTLQLIKDKNVLVEINFDSNVALDYVQQSKQIVNLVQAYVRSGVQTTLGSDGSGVLSTNLVSAMHALIRGGLPANDVETLSAISRGYYQKIMDHKPNLCARILEATL